MTNHCGGYIRKLREERKLLQRQLAVILDVDTPMVSKIERGERIAKREQLSQIANALEVSEDKLLTLWLADKIYEVIKDEGLGLEAIRIAERRYNYKKDSK